MKRFKIIEETALQKFGSFRSFCIETNQDYSNFNLEIEPMNIYTHNRGIEAVKQK